jgi:hypothetical protein
LRLRRPWKECASASHAANTSAEGPNEPRHGDNHFIVAGPLPSREISLALIRHWSLIQMGATTPSELDQWRIITREFRENLEWAVIVPGDTFMTPPL